MSSVDTLKLSIRKAYHKCLSAQPRPCCVYIVFPCHGNDINICASDELMYCYDGLLL